MEVAELAPLDMVKKGQKVRIHTINNPIVRAQALRFGISEGEVVSVEEIIPAGPIILGRKKQEIAVGRQLAQKILVEIL